MSGRYWLRPLHWQNPQNDCEEDSTGKMTNPAGTRFPPSVRTEWLIDGCPLLEAMYPLDADESDKVDCF